ncbi:MAG: hypothetical protein BWK78_00560 [Thiotrichaceae bacterium IS1]|nr:MAG: hypothetical protein BWK78_00560 [Thiotrichaceae bacterium IS1]
MQTAITVFIPVYNGANLIERAIKSVLCQTFANFALVVSDNCSTDETKAIVSNYLTDPRVKLIEKSQNVGVTENFNSCLRILETKYYMMLCHDDFLYKPQALAKAFEILETHPEVPAVYCDLLFVDSHSRVLLERRFNRSGLIQSDLVVRQSILSCRNQFGIPLLMRSSASQGVQPDDRLTYTGDVEFSFAYAKGKPIYHIPEFLIGNGFHETNSTRVHFHKVRPQMEIIAAKHGIPLSNFDKLRMRFNAGFVTLQKWVFFFYLKHLRKNR